MHGVGRASPGVEVSKGLSDQTSEVLGRIYKQSPDIVGGVHVGKDDLDVGAGDQDIMFGYVSVETEDCMPLTRSMAMRLGKELSSWRPRRSRRRRPPRRQGR